MTRLATALALTRIPVPQTLDGDDARLFRAIAEIGTAVCRHDAGHDHLDHTAQELLPSWQEQVDRTQVGYAVESGDEVLGIVTTVHQNGDAPRSLEFDLLVSPDRWGEGIEEMLLAAAEDEARRHGIPVVQTYSLHRADAPGEKLVPGTGWGSVPADDRQTRLMVAHGYALEQVERNSVLDLREPLPLVEAMLAEAVAAAGPDYRPIAWTLPTPDEWVEKIAYPISRMSTDVPAGDLVWDEEVWDAARVRRRDARLQAAGTTVSVSAVLHEPSGTIVAYNELALAGPADSATSQWGTLVLREHRGHRLGTVVKCANLLRWRDIAPESPFVSTFNAEENRPMLDINEAIGFVGVSVAGAWQKTL